MEDKLMCTQKIQFKIYKQCQSFYVEPREYAELDSPLSEK